MTACLCALLQQLWQNREPLTLNIKLASSHLSRLHCMHNNRQNMTVKKSFAFGITLSYRMCTLLLLHHYLDPEPTIKP